MDGYKKWCEEQEFGYGSWDPEPVKYVPSLTSCTDDELLNELKKRLNRGSFKPKEKDNINFTINYKSDKSGNTSKSMYQFNTVLDGMLKDKDEKVKEMVKRFFDGDTNFDDFDFDDSFEDTKKEKLDENGYPVISWDPKHLS